MFIWRVISLGLAGVLDLGAGMLIVTLLAEHFSYSLAWWQYVVGALLAASPDIDLLLGFFGKSLDEHHEYLTHRPIFGLPFAIFVGWLIGGEFWAYVAGFGVLWHYLHDTQGFLFLYDNGLAWFWPYSKKYWGIRNLRVVYRTPTELSQCEGGAFDSIYECYLTPTRRAVTEFALTSVSIGYVASAVFGSILGLAAALIFWMTIVHIWYTNRHYH